MKLQDTYDSDKLTIVVLADLMYEFCPIGSFDSNISVGLFALNKLKGDGLLIPNPQSSKGILAKTFNSTTVGFSLFQLAGGKSYKDYAESMRWVDAAQGIIDRLVQEKIIC